MGKAKKGLSDKVRKSQASKNRHVFKAQSNPFEVKINKQKHNILGRKSKHDRGLPGVSKSKANKKRKDTLLKEYKERHKSNNLQDDRFGEASAEMTVEEKMIKRFAMEKKKKHEKMSMFNLNDEEELTHFGQSLSNINDFGSSVVSDDEDNGAISAEYVAEAHFGGGIFTKKNADQEGDEEKPKTRKEIMDEIILKSKKAKYERQNTQEQSDALREKLDNTWQEVELLLKSSSKTKKDREREKYARTSDGYDTAVRQMLYDRKAAPASRGMSEAQKAAEESARIRRMEDERVRRMLGRKSAGSTEHRSADDLNDEFVAEKIESEPVYYKDGVMVGSDAATEDSGDWQLEAQIDDEEIGDGGDDENSEQGESDEEDDDNFSDILSDEGEISEESNPGKDDDSGHVSLVSDAGVSKGNQIFPATYDAFCKLCDKKYAGDAAKYVDELRKKHPPAAAVGNKDKMKKLFEFVWEATCRQFDAKVPNVTRADQLVSHLYELCQLNVTDCAKSAIKSLQGTYHRHHSDEGRLSQLPLCQMMQFKLIKVLFSTSDFSHPVCTPALLFMSNILKSHQPSSLRDLAYGLFLCTVAYEYVSFSKRFLPECINYLCAAMCFSVPKPVQKTKGIPASASLHITAKNCQLLAVERSGNYAAESIGKPNLLRLLSGSEDETANDDVLRLQLQAAVLRLTLKFVVIYGKLPCFKEIFDPIRVACKRCAMGHRLAGKDGAGHPLAKLLSDIPAEIQRVLMRRPALSAMVQTESNRPKALPLHDPRIEPIGEPFRKGSQKKMGSSRRDLDRLKHKHKREFKGAVREIKKDARFLAREKLNEQIEKDQERAAKVKRLFGFLSNQEGEVKKINRKKFKIDVS